MTEPPRALCVSLTQLREDNLTDPRLQGAPAIVEDILLQVEALWVEMLKEGVSVIHQIVGIPVFSVILKSFVCLGAESNYSTPRSWNRCLTFPFPYQIYNGNLKWAKAFMCTGGTP